MIVDEVYRPRIQLSSWSLHDLTSLLVIADGQLGSCQYMNAQLNLVLLIETVHGDTFFEFVTCPVGLATLALIDHLELFADKSTA